MVPPTPTPDHLSQLIQQAVAPVFLLAGIGAFLNVCASRLARIVDRARQLEPDLIASIGREHDRLRAELRLLDRRIKIVNTAIFSTVLAALLVCGVVVVQFVAALTGAPLVLLVASLFVAAISATGAGFAIFLHETRLATRAVRVHNALLDHEEDGDRNGDGTPR